MNMKYFLLRRPTEPEVITSTHKACAWDVAGIMKQQGGLYIPGLLYKHPEFNMIFLNETDESTYDMLEAFGVTQCHSCKLNVITAQEIRDHNGITKTVHRNQSGILELNEIHASFNVPAVSIITRTLDE